MTSLAGVVWMVLWVLALLVMPTVRVLQVKLAGCVFCGGLMVRRLLVLVLGVACAWVVGGTGRRVPPLLAGGLAYTD